MGWGTLGMVLDWSGDSPDGPGWVGDPRIGLGRVGGTSGMSGTSWGTLEEVRYGLGDPPKVRDVLRNTRADPGWVCVPFGRSWMGQGTLEVVQDRSGDPRGGLGWVGGPSGRSKTS